VNSEILNENQRTLSAMPRNVGAVTGEGEKPHAGFSPPTAKLTTPFAVWSSEFSQAGSRTRHPAGKRSVLDVNSVAVSQSGELEKRGLLPGMTRRFPHVQSRGLSRESVPLFRSSRLSALE
jgi:hypothetical protein